MKLNLHMGDKPVQMMKTLDFRNNPIEIGETPILIEHQ